MLLMVLLVISIVGLVKETAYEDAAQYLIQTMENFGLGSHHAAFCL